MSKKLVQKVNLVACTREPKFIRKQFIELLSQGAANSLAPGQIDTAPLFFTALVENVGTIDASTIAWSFVIGAAALAATAASAVLRALTPNRTPLALALALVCAYGAYELTLLAATTFLGGVGAFTMTIVARLGLLNIVWLIELVVACEIIRLIDPFGRKSPRQFVPQSPVYTPPHVFAR
jgi:hypothetical protein